MAKYPIAEETIGAVYTYSDGGVCFIPWYWEWSYEQAVKNGKLIMEYWKYKQKYGKTY